LTIRISALNGQGRTEEPKIIKGLPIFSSLFNQRLVFCVCLGILLLMPVTASSAEKVIYNKSVAAYQTANASKLRSIFSMRRRTWEDGTAIQVFVLPDDHPAHKAFCKNILATFPHRLRKTWDRLVFTGTGQAPQEVASEEEMLLKINSTPGAIGYLSEEKTDAAANKNSD
jgi:ABC-type phosphate transport system substrate-binding protein